MGKKEEEIKKKDLKDKKDKHELKEVKEEKEEKGKSKGKSNTEIEAKSKKPKK